MFDGLDEVKKEIKLFAKVVVGLLSAIAIFELISLFKSK